MEHHHPQSSLLQLPNLVLDSILGYLTYYELLNIRPVCRKMDQYVLAVLRRKRTMRISTCSRLDIEQCQLFNFSLGSLSSIDLAFQWPIKKTRNLGAFQTHFQRLLGVDIIQKGYEKSLAKMCHRCPFVCRLEISCANNTWYQFAPVLTMLLLHWRRTLTHFTLVMDHQMPTSNHVFESILTSDTIEVGALLDTIAELPALRYISMPIELKEMLVVMKGLVKQTWITELRCPSFEHVNFQLPNWIESNESRMNLVHHFGDMFAFVRSFGIATNDEDYYDYDDEFYDDEDNDDRDVDGEEHHSLLQVLCQQNHELVQQKLTRLRTKLYTVPLTEQILSHCLSLRYLFLKYGLGSNEKEVPLNAILQAISRTLHQLQHLSLIFTEDESLASFSPHKAIRLQSEIEPKTLVNPLLSVQKLELDYPALPNMFAPLRKLFPNAGELIIYWWNRFGYWSTGIDSEFAILQRTLCRTTKKSTTPIGDANFGQFCVHNCDKIHKELNSYKKSRSRPSTPHNFVLRTMIASNGTVEHCEMIDWCGDYRYIDDHKPRYQIPSSIINSLANTTTSDRHRCKVKYEHERCWNIPDCIRCYEWLDDEEDEDYDMINE